MDSKEDLLKKICVHLSSYSSQKIRYAADKVVQEERDILFKIKQMRKIANDIFYNTRYSNVNYFSIRKWTFYQQAKYMVDVEDNYMHSVTPMYSYFWDYESLEVPELRTYLTLRTKIRKGEYPKIDTSYLFIYCSEIINLIGFQDSKEAFQQLKKLISVYYNEITEPYYATLFRNIVKDFIINYEIPVSCQEYYEMFQMDQKYEEYQQKVNVFQGNYENVLFYLDKNSSYKVCRSIFYNSKYGFLIEKAIPPVFHALEEYFQKNGFDFKKIALGEKKDNNNYSLFQNFPYVEVRENYEALVSFSPLEDYLFVNKNCNANIYVESFNMRVIVGFLLKKIESRIRERTKFKRKITANPSMLEAMPVPNKRVLNFMLNPEFVSVIEEAIDRFLKEEQESIKKELLEQRKAAIVVDRDTFDEIREATQRVQEKLVTEDEKWEEVPNSYDSSFQVEEIPEQEPITEMGMMALVQHFTEVEKKFIQKILSGGSRVELEEIVKEQGMLLEVFVENINVKALEFISDNLLQDLIDTIEIYEDYEEELNECLKEVEHGE